MSKILTSLTLSLCLIMALVLPVNKAYALDPKVKVMASTSLYGATGGALLGFASMAFGTSARSIAKGASLGLYAGILFGGYIIASHHLRPQLETPYEDSDSPYESDGQGAYDSSGSSAPKGEESPQLFERAFKVNQYELNYKARQVPTMYLDIVRFEF